MTSHTSRQYPWPRMPVADFLRFAARSSSCIFHPGAMATWMAESVSDRSGALCTEEPQHGSSAPYHVARGSTVTHPLGIPRRGLALCVLQRRGLAFGVIFAAIADLPQHVSGRRREHEMTERIFRCYAGPVPRDGGPIVGQEIGPGGVVGRVVVPTHPPERLRRVREEFRVEPLREEHVGARPPARRPGRRRALAVDADDARLPRGSGLHPLEAHASGRSAAVAAARPPDAVAKRSRSENAATPRDEEGARTRAAQDRGKEGERSGPVPRRSRPLKALPRPCKGGDGGARSPSTDGCCVHFFMYFLGVAD